MAAYAALVSLIHLIRDIKNHPFPPISIDNQQVESLTDFITSLQEFLQGYSSSAVADIDEADPLEIRIARAAYAAEDVIESHIVGVVKWGTTTAALDQESDSLEEANSKDEVSCISLYEDLQQVVEEMILIEKYATEMAHDRIPASRSSSVVQNENALKMETF